MDPNINPFQELNQEDLDLAKRRIWAQMSSKLPERGFSVFQNELRSLRGASLQAKAPRLLKVQGRERLSMLLPERVPSVSYAARFQRVFMQKRVWSLATLSVFFAILFAPVFKYSPMVSAEVSNALEVDHGTVQIFRGERVITLSAAGIATVLEGDRLLTGADSVAHIHFVDDSRLTLGPKSEVVLTELFVSPDNRARSEVVIDQLRGRTWSQVLNLVGNESFYALRFPQGEVVARQRASFDLNASIDESVLKVARNVVETVVVTEEEVYQGRVAQGAELSMDEDVDISLLNEEDFNDAWWTFNVTYGEDYADSIEEKYRVAALAGVSILPGHPLYQMKLFQEYMQGLFSVTEEAQKNTAISHAQNRLSEAKALVAQGETGKAAEALDAFDRSLARVATLATEEDLLGQLEETQKELLVLQSEEADLLQTHVTEAQAVFTDDPELILEANLLTASQKLERVPDLIFAGDFALANQSLNDYKEFSLKILEELKTLSLAEREALLESVLEQKLKDLQILRMIASMPELEGQEGVEIDVSAQMLEELSLMVLSLRERELAHLSEFLSAENLSEESQLDLYTRIKDSTEISTLLDEQLLTLETAIAESSEVIPSEELLVELSSDPVLEDPRFETIAEIEAELNSHSDETEDETEGGEESTEYPETHDDL